MRAQTRPASQGRATPGPTIGFSWSGAWLSLAGRTLAGPLAASLLKTGDSNAGWTELSWAELTWRDVTWRDQWAGTPPPHHLSISSDLHMMTSEWRHGVRPPCLVLPVLPAPSSPPPPLPSSCCCSTPSLTRTSRSVSLTLSNSQS